MTLPAVLEVDQTTPREEECPGSYGHDN
jgi:hypothetical protein